MRRPHALKAFFKKEMIDMGLSNTDISHELGITRESVSRKLAKDSNKWTLQDIVDFGRCTDADVDDILHVLGDILWELM